jgi:hypothetical protein
MFKIIVSFILALFPQLCVRVGILLPFGKHLCNRIIALRAEVSAHKASLNLSFVIEVPGQSQKIECICVGGLGTIPKLKIKTVEKGNIDTHNTQIHDSSLSWLGSGASIACCVDKPVK